ncbi:MAG: hypothetical protein PUF41_11740 [Prevotella copri]|nr:hypothetical protein [Segatella copri]
MAWLDQGDKLKRLRWVDTPEKSAGLVNLVNGWFDSTTSYRI